MIKIPEFIEDLPEDKVQPVLVHRQGPFVAIIQRDGTDEMVHWALIEIEKVEQVIDEIRKAAQ